VKSFSHFSSISSYDPIIIKEFISLISLKAQVNAYAHVFLVSGIIVLIGAGLSLFLKVKNEKKDDIVFIE